MSYERNQIVTAFLQTKELENNNFDCPNGLLCSKSCGNISKYLNNNCENTMICTEMGCTCYKGLTGDKCDKHCINNRYGYWCKENCGQCLYNSCDSITGICKNSQCNNMEKYYISPYCKTVINVPPPPIINFINETYVSNNSEDLNESTCSYKNVFSNTTIFETDFKFLKPGINYSIWCNLRYGQEGTIIEGLSKNVTIPCDVNASFNIETNETYLTITDDNSLINNEGINYSCPWVWYNLLIYQEDNIKNIIYEGNLNKIPFTLEVIPATIYNLYISGNNRNILSKSILTDDGEPSKVTEVQIIKPSNDQVYIQWKPPEQPNGKIKKYEVNLMVDVYYGCVNYDQSLISKYNKTKYTTMTNVRFFNLPLYAKYIITIAAYNSKKGLKIDKSFTTNSTDIPRSILSNLKYENNRITWGKPKDCTTISGPIIVTKIIFTGISEAVQNQTFIRETSKLYFDVKALTLENYEKYKVQIFPIRNYHKPHNDSTGVELIFITPSKPPTSVRELDIYEFDDRTMTISLRWQEPLPPNGVLDYYSVNNYYYYQYFKLNNMHVVFPNESCTLWKNYICSKIVLTINVYNRITVTGYNKNVNIAGNSAITYYNPKTIATKPDPPKYLTIINDYKGIINLTWSHPWKTNTPLDKFDIQIQMLDNNLKENNWKSVRNKYYYYKIKKYQQQYNWRINLLSSTTYNISVQAVTIKNETSELKSSMIRTPDSITFENNKLSYMVESNTSILLKIPRLLNDTKNSKMFIVIKGEHPCKRYTKLNNYLRESTNIKNNEIAWLAASFSADKYSGKEFSIGDNKKYDEGTNCPFILYNVYTIYVIVQTENVTLLLSLKTNRFLFITKSYDIWPIYLVVILIIIFFFVFDLHRRYNERNLRINNFPLNEIVQQTNENIQKVKPTLPILSEKSSSINRSKENLQLLVDNIQMNDSTMMTIKVKDFEDYVRNAIKLGLLDQQYESFPRGQTKSWDCGKLPQNKCKNRYGNLIAYDETRVVLKKLEDDPFSDYINANYIKGYKKEKRYIATQGPKKNTIVDFWRMIWQENVFVICMLTNLIENGKIKCEQYWPDIGKKKKYGDIMVFNSTHNIFADYTFRILHVTCNDETRKIEHLHYTAWPDHGVPIYIHSVGTFLKIILAKKIGNGPMVVHCSAGIGRSGTIILCDICLRRAAAEGVVNVFSEMQSIRNERANMVDNKQQYLFVHLVLIDCLLSLPTSLPCNDALPTKIKDLKKQLEIQFRRYNKSSIFKKISSG
ncbi:PREDICTED: uncharacterized protein LOC106790368 [Polistes canadensis]|uniref:uncharacterized protein LOC106790368 n=1 Tax=Polistes canadensis TaxID=91411 RepID=UPI000718EEFC|nr:PREDICTED: uncharacterized protein LOC106790368 [Polistes canadensis]